MPFHEQLTKRIKVMHYFYFKRVLALAFSWSFSYRDCNCHEYFRGEQKHKDQL